VTPGNNDNLSNPASSAEQARGTRSYPIMLKLQDSGAAVDFAAATPPELASLPRSFRSTKRLVRPMCSRKKCIVSIPKHIESADPRRSQQHAPVRARRSIPRRRKAMITIEIWGPQSPPVTPEQRAYTASAQGGPASAIKRAPWSSCLPKGDVFHGTETTRVRSNTPTPSKNHRTSITVQLAIRIASACRTGQA